MKCSKNSSEKLSAKADAKNSQKSKIILLFYSFGSFIFTLAFINTNNRTKISHYSQGLCYPHWEKNKVVKIYKEKYAF